VAEDWPSETDRRELRGLVARIKRGDCVLVLGPRTAVRPDDPERTPFDELLAREIVDALRSEIPAIPPAAATLRGAAELHHRIRRDREDLELLVQDFYARHSGQTTDFHRNLAQLPFRLCVNASPDGLMFTAFAEAGKRPHAGYYSFARPAASRVGPPTVEQPLVYQLFGSAEDPRSLVLTEGDLIEFLVSVVRGTPPLPDQVRSVLADPAASCLFLGFGFENWYLRVLLQVLNVYGHRSRTLAFEDRQFFEHPDHEQTVGFFSGERLIDFRRLQWEPFARHLREAHGTISRPLAPQSSAEAAGGPRVFLSYASEDREQVEALSDSLQVRGIRVWQDAQDLRAGDDWNRVLVDVIARKVDYVVVVQTPNMLTRVTGVFHREIDVALKRQGEMGELDGERLRFLLPVRLGDCPTLSTLTATHVLSLKDTGDVEKLVDSILEDWRRRAELRTRHQAVA
jgi:hypothetical protein